MYKVRFHLGRGNNFGHWQITGAVSPHDKIPKSIPFYCDPDNVCLHMFNSKLVNHVATATKINCGANKSVCSWIECENLLIHRKDSEHSREAFQHINSVVVNTYPELFYNPKKVPYWVGHNGINMDYQDSLIIYTFKKRLFHRTKSIIF